MALSKKDYRKIYNLQDKFLDWWKTLELPFYLTGGTALGRYYLNHRFSEDLDYFVNSDSDYPEYIKTIQKEIFKMFSVDTGNVQYTEDFTRFFILDDPDSDVFLKVEFINDVPFRKGKPVAFQYGILDTPENILSNKLGAIIGRDEPKDIVDIVYMSNQYRFNWKEIFIDAKSKTIINEVDVEKVLYAFPIEKLESVDWFIGPFDINLFKAQLSQIADDFLWGRDNSLCKGKIHISEAEPMEGNN